MPGHPERMVGVVEFNSQAWELASLTNDENQAVGAVNRVGANGGMRIDLGIVEGLRVLSQGRSGFNRDELNEVMIVLTASVNNTGCAPVLSAARQARGQGVLIIAVCLGPSCDEWCMRQAASGPHYFYDVSHPSYLRTTFDAIGQQLLYVAHARLKITDTWGDRFAFVADSAAPPQTVPDVPQHWLQWEGSTQPMSGVTYTLRLRPLRAGTQLANEEATGELIDYRGRTVSWSFELPRITVLDPAGPQTPTPNPSPMMTPTATVSTPAATATATTASATPTEVGPSETALYLPRVLRGQ